MKPIEVHPISALLGSAVLGLVLIAAGAVRVTSTQQAPNASPKSSIITAPITIDNPITVNGIPAATPWNAAPARAVLGRPGPPQAHHNALEPTERPFRPTMVATVALERAAPQFPPRSSP